MGEVLRIVTCSGQFYNLAPKFSRTDQLFHEYRVKNIKIYIGELSSRSICYIWDHSFDHMFGQVFGQVFDQIFGKVSGKVWKYSFASRGF